ncbi:MAG: fructosamine kinase family protein [Cyclobacteriaceae bacterium]
MNHELLPQIIHSATDDHTELISVQSVSGGCINNAFRVVTKQNSYFIKTNDFEQDLFEKERDGLKILNEKSDLNLPNTLGIGKINGTSFLLQEYVSGSHKNDDFWEHFGTQLAKMHMHHADHYGLSFDNHIGKLHQPNQIKDDWITFFIENRLGYQLHLGKQVIPGKIKDQFQLLFKQLPDLVPIEPPSLLHGDLWSGNFMTGENGYACIFDPAVYFGHREMELSFTTMFGGFDEQFYASYANAYPFVPGFSERIPIHNLYPLLVHVNLFGLSYLSGIKTTLKKYVG